MRTLSLLIFGVSALSSACAGAAERQVWHYLGEVRISSASGQPVPSQVILLEKTHDPEKGVISERAITVKPDGSADYHTVTMTVKGDDVTCSINGTVVGKYDKKDLVTAGKLKSLDGMYGIRMAHNTEAIVTGFSMTKN